MTLDALRLEVPDILEENAMPLATLPACLLQARGLAQDAALREVLELLFRLNRSALTLLERQRVLQNFSDEYRHYASAYRGGTPPPLLFLRLCHELATGFKRLLLQILQGRTPSKPHLAWCLYMAQHFLAQCVMRHYQLYQEPPRGLWLDSHLLYWIGEHQQCLDEHVAAAFQPTPACTLRGIYQQQLLLALSNPFHLAEGECPRLFAALAPFAELARLLPVEEDEDIEGALVDLSQDQASLPQQAITPGNIELLRRLELGPLLIALHDPAPLQERSERELLERVRHNWLGRQQRRHDRAEQAIACSMVVGLPQIHAHLLEHRPLRVEAQMLDNSPGGARLLCSPQHGQQLQVGQLLLLPETSSSPLLAMVRWRHQNVDGLYLGLRYLKGLPRPVWLRRAPNAQTHPGVLQSTPAPGNGWHHGLWLNQGQFVEGENLWLQLLNVNTQTIVPLPAANLNTPLVIRHPLRLG